MTRFDSRDLELPRRVGARGRSLRWWPRLLLLSLAAGFVWGRPALAPNRDRELCAQGLERVAGHLCLFRQIYGAPPRRLEELVDAGYLSALPTCPAAGVRTVGYELSPDGRRFTLLCCGRHHGNPLRGQPRVVRSR